MSAPKIEHCAERLRDLLADARRATRLALDAIEADDAAISEGEAELHRALAEFEKRHRANADKRSVILQAQNLQLEALGVRPEEPRSEQPASTEPQVTEVGKQSRARIGPQRYHIFVALRNHGPKTVEGIVGMTHLTTKRVKEQLRTDSDDGYVRSWFGEPSVEVFDLTDSGRELLVRFENYRRSNNKPLPTLAEAAADGGGDDKETSRPQGAQVSPTH